MAISNWPNPSFTAKVAKDAKEKGELFLRPIFRNDRAPLAALRDFREKLDIVLLQQVPERPIRNLEQFSGADLHAAGLLQS